MATRDLDPDQYKVLRRVARQVLESNRIEGRRSTLPAPGQYPHQWNWDSAFVAIGLACIDVERAREEVEALLDGQWANGMVPHIIYNPDPETDKMYFPDREVWGTQHSDVGEGPSARGGTSGITQPPVVAIAAEYIHRKSKDLTTSLEFLDRIYPKLLKYHRYLLKDRDPQGEGLAFLIHPWESGMDNSPRWQPILDSIEVNPDSLPPYKRLDDRLVRSEQRPTSREYDRYVYLIEVFKAYRYNSEELFKHSPFLVHDVLFNAVLYRANKALLEIADELGNPKAEIEDWMERTRNSFSTKLWSNNHGRFLDFDLRTGRPIDENTIATFVPLFAELASAEQAQRLVMEHLRNSEEYWPRAGHSQFLVPTASKDNRLWSPVRYWRGPIWVNTNWLVIKGLEAYGYEEEGFRIRQHTLGLLCNRSSDAGERWFGEYFNPLNGDVCGVNNFSLSAALAIELTENSPLARRRLPM